MCRISHGRNFVGDCSQAGWIYFADFLCLFTKIGVGVGRKKNTTARILTLGLHRSWHWLDVSVVLNPQRGRWWQSLPMSIKFSLDMPNLLQPQLPPVTHPLGFIIVFELQAKCNPCTGALWCVGLSSHPLPVCANATVISTVLRLPDESSNKCIMKHTLNQTHAWIGNTRMHGTQAEMHTHAQCFLWS